MSTVTIPLSDELSSKLREAAQRAGVSPEELARAGLSDWLGRPRDDFDAAVRFVLEKNRELYRRLA
jgi:predicted transcriptional regulator